MRTLAYCALSRRQSVKKASGVEPLTCPPLDAKSFDPSNMEGQDLLYLKLHGLASQPFWYGDNWITALRADQLDGLDLFGTVAFVATCYLPEAPIMLQALKRTGAIIIGGAGENEAGFTSREGSDLLGFWLRIALQTGLPAIRSLCFSKAMLKGHAKLAKGIRKKAIIDALEFKVL